MNKILTAAAAIVIILISSCEANRFKEFDNGLQYKIIKSNSGKAVKEGDFLEATVWRYYNDSLISSGHDSIPQIVRVDTLRMNEYGKIFTAAEVGDSIITRISTDTFAKYSGGLPPFAKPHQFLGTNFRIVSILENQEAAEKANFEINQRIRKADSLAFERQKKIDDNTIQEYLKKNKIDAVKSPEGTYVQVIDEGTGQSVENGKSASVLYKGMLLDGKIFDQSYDSSGNATNPFTFVVGQQGAISGWSDGMIYFKEGGKGRLFIPSSRAYGPQGAGQEIAPNTPIMFDVQITKVQSQEQAAAERQKLMEDRQRQLQTQPTP